MYEADWLERTMGLTAASRVVDGALVALLVTAIVTLWLTGLTPAIVVALVVGGVAIEHAISWATRRRILETVDATGTEPDDSLCALVDTVADRMELPRPTVVVEDSQGAGVTVLQGSDGPVLLLARPLLSGLDDAALRSVIAHELAHLGDGHIGRFDSRDPIAHVIGATAFWVAVGRHLDPLLSLIGLATYVGAGAFRGSVLPQLYYLCASLGVVLVPLGLIAWAHRLQEHQADDRAVALTSPRAFCRGLLHVATAHDDDSLSEELLGTAPAHERRGLIARVTATHPPLERRFARYGLSIDDVRAE